MDKAGGTDLGDLTRKVNMNNETYNVDNEGVIDLGSQV